MALSNASKHDLKTIKYFDEYLPDYGKGRLASVIKYLNENGVEGRSLLDVGCGTGGTLKHIQEQTGISNLAGMDVSEGSLKQAAERTGCRTMAGSVLDKKFIASIDQQFDYVVVIQILHHLIGPNREASRQCARQAIENTLPLLKPDGALIVIEPCFTPKVTMDLVFYTKKIISKFSNKRLTLFSRWNNFGAPVVSYYNEQEMLGFFEQTPSVKLEGLYRHPGNLTTLIKLTGIKKQDITFVGKRAG
jgi:2-polyprenyl-3-methyl-5-hydroxy-6-metoxy-1,4-benzoquinol methylase